MRHHLYNPNFKFVKEPVEFNKYTDREILQYCLGGTLYMPATKDVLNKIFDKSIPGLTSMVMCCEDAIPEDMLSEAEMNVINHLEKISQALKNGDVTRNDIPLIFIRVRSPEQFKNFTGKLSPDQLSILTGFVFPKVDASNGHDYFDFLQSVNRNTDDVLYGMPILEGRKIALNETRPEELNALKNIFTPFKNLILNIRVGVNDFSSIFGVRRGINYTIYDILTVRDCLADILNYFSRDGEEYVISAPVWEYFLADKKEDLSHLLEEDIHRSLLTRSSIVNDAIDGLLREVILDKANGFVGKTIIHPSHLRYVNALQAVTREEYEDSCQILESRGGVSKGANNKMNEKNPHKSWAKRVANIAEAYGVIENESSYLKLCLC